MDNVNILKSIFSKSIEANASDLHLITHEAPIMRVDGKLMPVPDEKPLEASTCEGLISLTLKPEQIGLLKKEKEIETIGDIMELLTVFLNIIIQLQRLAFLKQKLLILMMLMYILTQLVIS